MLGKLKYHETGYTREDLEISQKLHSSPKGREKICRAFAKSPFRFDFHIVPLSHPVNHPQIQETPNTITVVFTNNITFDNMPLTAWMLAHRIGHTVQLSGLFDKCEFDILRPILHLYDTTVIITKPYRLGIKLQSDRVLERFVDSLLTMKSARDGIIGNRFGTEGLGELLAQYIITGRVRFNQVEGFDFDKIKTVENRVNELIHILLTSMMGKVFSF